MRSKEHGKSHSKERPKDRLRRFGMPTQLTPSAVRSVGHGIISKGSGWETAFHVTSMGLIRAPYRKRGDEHVAPRGPEAEVKDRKKAELFLRSMLQQQDTREESLARVGGYSFFTALSRTPLQNEIYNAALKEFGNTESLQMYNDLRQRLAGYAFARIGREMVKLSAKKGSRVLAGREAFLFVKNHFYQHVPEVPYPFDQTTLQGVSVPDGFVVGEDGKITHGVEYTLGSKSSFVGALEGFTKLRSAMPGLFAPNARLLIVLPQKFILSRSEQEQRRAGFIDVLHVPFGTTEFGKWFNRFISRYSPQGQPRIDEVATSSLERHGVSS